MLLIYANSKAKENLREREREERGREKEGNRLSNLKNNNKGLGGKPGQKNALNTSILVAQRE
jgi:hypothetical protein